MGLRYRLKIRKVRKSSGRGHVRHRRVQTTRSVVIYQSTPWTDGPITAEITLFIHATRCQCYLVSRTSRSRSATRNPISGNTSAVWFVHKQADD
jgi:hypothetical protein